MVHLLLLRTFLWLMVCTCGLTCGLYSFATMTDEWYLIHLFICKPFLNLLVDKYLCIETHYLLVYTPIAIVKWISSVWSAWSIFSFYRYSFYVIQIYKWALPTNCWFLKFAFWVLNSSLWRHSCWNWWSVWYYTWR